VDPESLPNYPGVPFTIATTAADLSFTSRISANAHVNPVDLPTRELTFFALTPSNLQSYGTPDSSKQRWDEPPPSYDYLFPISLEAIKCSTINKEIKCNPPQPQTEL
jgi:hypothetical protein